MMNCVYKPTARNYPFFDCYGFVKWLYEREHNVEICDFDYIDPNDAENEKYFIESMNSLNWVKVLPQKGAIVALKVDGHISHCGYMTSKREFVHIMEKTGVARIKINNPLWADCIVGYYKWSN